MDWIAADDDTLMNSITRHEGGKDIIYHLIRNNTISVIPGCNFTACEADGKWPAYLDTENLSTVGYGHLITGHELFDCTQGITDEQADELLKQDIPRSLQAAQRICDQYNMAISGNHTVQRFMVEMCFNIGESGYLKFKNGLRKLASAVNRDGQYSYNDAADEHLDSTWARQVKARAIEMTDNLRSLDNI